MRRGLSRFLASTRLMQSAERLPDLPAVLDDTSSSLTRTFHLVPSMRLWRPAVLLCRPGRVVTHFDVR